MFSLKFQTLLTVGEFFSSFKVKKKSDVRGQWCGGLRKMETDFRGQRQKHEVGDVFNGAGMAALRNSLEADNFQENQINSEVERRTKRGVSFGAKTRWSRTTRTLRLCVQTQKK